MNYFEEIKNIITKAKSDKELDEAKNYMYIHGYLMEMNQNERCEIRGLIDEQRCAINEQVSEFAYNEHVADLQDELTNAGFQCGQDATGVFSAGTYNALQTALNTYLQLKQTRQLNENSIDEIAWVSLEKHKNIQKTDPVEWAQWAVSNPNDAVKIVTNWLEESNGDVEIVTKIANCISNIPQNTVPGLNLRNKLKEIYYIYTNQWEKANQSVPQTQQTTTSQPVASKNTPKSKQPTMQGYGPANIQTFNMAGIVKNNYIKSIQMALKQTNDFIVDTLDGTFDQGTLTACKQLLYKINKLRKA